MGLEVSARAGDLVGHAAQQLAAIGKLDLLALRLRGAGLRRRNDACDQRRALEQRAPRHVGGRDAGGGFIAAAHERLLNIAARALRRPKIHPDGWHVVGRSRSNPNQLNFGSRIEFRRTPPPHPRIDLSSLADLTRRLCARYALDQTGVQCIIILVFHADLA
jgi:hypothetical protein